MRSLELSNLEIADLCRELALLLHSGIGAGDSLYLMAEEEKDPRSRDLLAAMAKAIVQADAGLKEIYLNTISLEDYYLGVTGGGKHNG